MNTDIFSRLENGALRTLLNVSAISLCVFTLSGLVFFRLEAWAQRQEINVQLAAIALDGDTMVAQVRRALIESHRGLGSH